MRELGPCCICKCAEYKILYPSTLPQDGSGAPGLDPYSGHYQINVCKGCGLIFSSPILDQHHVEALYTGYSESNVTDNEIRNVRRTMAGYYRLAAPYVRGKDRFLDVGCDLGLLLQVAQAEGFQHLYGVEPVTAARRKAIARLPEAAIRGTFYEQADFEAEFFDIVALIHVLDHLVRPDRILERVFMHLKPGGLCLAVVHDVASLLARRMGERFPAFNYFHHYFFSQRTLRALLEVCGFDVLRVVPTRNCYSLAFFIERFPFLPIRARRVLARVARSLWFGRIPLFIPVGNIGIVARKPMLTGAAHTP